MVNFISRYYNWILITITFISLIFLISNNISSLWIFKYYDSDESYSNGNGIWNNILTGFICSAIFYWIVQYFPEKNKRNIAYKISEKNYSNIKNNIEDLLNIYNTYYFKHSDIKEIKEIDFNKIEYFNIHSLIEVKGLNTLNTNQSEMRFILRKIKKINLDIDIIFSNPYLNNKDLESINQIYNIRNSLSEYIQQIENQINYYMHTTRIIYEISIDNNDSFILDKPFILFSNHNKELKEFQEILLLLYKFYKLNK